MYLARFELHVRPSGLQQLIMSPTAGQMVGSDTATLHYDALSVGEQM